jgi:hypothetical protein
MSAISTRPPTAAPTMIPIFGWTAALVVVGELFDASMVGVGSTMLSAAVADAASMVVAGRLLTSARVADADGSGEDSLGTTPTFTLSNIVPHVGVSGFLIQSTASLRSSSAYRRQLSSSSQRGRQPQLSVLSKHLHMPSLEPMVSQYSFLPLMKLWYLSFHFLSWERLPVRGQSFPWSSSRPFIRLEFGRIVCSAKVGRSRKSLSESYRTRVSIIDQ